MIDVMAKGKTKGIEYRPTTVRLDDDLRSRLSKLVGKVERKDGTGRPYILNQSDMLYEAVRQYVERMERETR